MRIKRIFTALLTVAMITMSMTGCGNRQNVDGLQNQPSQVFENTDTKVISNNSNTGNSMSSFFEKLTGIYATDNNSAPDVIYEQPIAGVSKDYVFEFDASVEATYVSFKAFDVYPNSNLEGPSYSRCVVEDGKIIVKPDGAIVLDENGSHNSKEEVWGSMNQLYLVQRIDLQTGEDLEVPIVTPFKVAHDVTAVSVSQTVDDYGNYMLEWNDVGADSYRVYACIGDGAYMLQGETTDTYISTEEFSRQQELDSYGEIIAKEMGREYTGVLYMNSGVNSYIDDSFVVVAVKGDKTSGISNEVFPADIAGLTPYAVVNSPMVLDIESISDVPNLLDVRMIDGSVVQYIIDYHGAQAYKYPDEPKKIAIEAKVANTRFSNVLIVLNGMDFQEVVDNFSVVKDREDELLANARTGRGITKEVTTNINREENEEATKKASEAAGEDSVTVEPQTPETTEDDSAVEEPQAPETTEDDSAVEEPQAPETTEDNLATDEPKAPETTPEKNSGLRMATGSDKPEQLYNTVLADVENRLNKIGIDEVVETIYAYSDLELWLSLCLVANEETIPCPVSVFNEAANLDYLGLLFVESYRQNPTSGAISSINYSNEYQALVVTYCEDSETRLNKAVKEYQAAKQIASSITNSNMSDLDKVMAINDYFCKNASYDHSSAETDVDMTSLSESFIDAHTPYGILINNYGVCESYSEAFILTARFAGLDAIAEIGTLHGGGHEWNRVEIDGQWYVLDVTNNDQDYFANCLLNITDEQMAGTLVSSGETLVDNDRVRATNETKEYYYVNGLCVDNVQDMVDIANSMISEKGYATLRLPTGATESTYLEYAKEFSRLGVSFNRYGGFSNCICLIK